MKTRLSGFYSATFETLVPIVCAAAGTVKQVHELNSPCVHIRTAKCDQAHHSAVNNNVQ